MTAPFENRNRKPLAVRFRDLEPFQPGTLRSYCPSCRDGNGLLLMTRDSRTFELLAFDCCTLCGQVVYYEDIEDMRQNGGHP